MRNFTPLDKFVIGVDNALRTVVGKPMVSERPYPAEDITDTEMSDKQRKHTAGLMRVNHAGEVSAQALYQGQALTARDKAVRKKLEQSAIEENDHLAWTENRLHELGDRTSILNPLWYAGSFAIGAFAGALGDKWSLGFLAETEHQVVRHLDSHLEQIPVNDERSRAVLEQMKIDETHHANAAIENGAAQLAPPVKKLMAAMSKVMTQTAYTI